MLPHNGEPSNYLFTAGAPPISRYDSILAESYLSSAYTRPFARLYNYLKYVNTTPYDAENIVLWVEPFEGWKSDDQYTSWPRYLYPALESILADNDDNLFVVTRNIVKDLIYEIGSNPAITLHESRGEQRQKLVVLTMPLPPHESMSSISSHASGSVEFAPMADPSVICDE
jgi:hypothetical protein